MRRWWTLTTSYDFLSSGASRRTAWRMLLPVPGLLAMLADSSLSNLVLLDASASIALLAAAFLPPATLWSDVVICIVHSAFYAAHSFVLSRERLLLPPEELEHLVPWSCQVLSVFAMASAGVHSAALAAFEASAAVSSLVLQCSWTAEQVVACIYVLAIGFFAERRLAQLVCAKQAHELGYKELIEQPHELGYKAMSLSSSTQENHLDLSASRISADPFSPSLTAEPFSRGESDGEDSGWYHRAAAMTSSRSSNTVADYVFSLMPGRPAQRQRFAAEQVHMPGAASHEAPLFAERLEAPVPSEKNGMEVIGGVPVSSRSLSSLGAPTSRTLDSNPPEIAVPREAPLQAPEPARFAEAPFQPPVSPPPAEEKAPALRGIKLSGFRQPELNVLYVESTDPAAMINGRETYWSATNETFLYRSEATNTWGVAKAKRFKAVKEGTSNGIAHSPEGYEIWDFRGQHHQSRRGWREWDASISKWATRPNSGVESRGKVRPKAPALDKASQTERPALRDEESQTDVPPSKSILKATVETPQEK